MMSKEWNKLDGDTRALIESFQTEFPVKLGELADRLGIIVKVATLEIGISGEISPLTPGNSIFKIRINRHEVKQRQRFTLAHEIAHFLLHRQHIGDGIVDNILFRSRLSNAVEAEANRLAADILMPDAAVKEWRERHQGVSKRDSLTPLAEMFGVSEDAMAVRLGLK
jgi:Zn-dependent peptidase ImmA (M78 family)